MHGPPNAQCAAGFDNPKQPSTALGNSEQSSTSLTLDQFPLRDRPPLSGSGGCVRAVGAGHWGTEEAKQQAPSMVDAAIATARASIYRLVGNLDGIG